MMLAIGITGTVSAEKIDSSPDVDTNILDGQDKALSCVRMICISTKKKMRKTISIAQMKKAVLKQEVKLAIAISAVIS